MGGRGSSSPTYRMASGQIEFDGEVDTSYRLMHQPNKYGGMLTDISYYTDPDDLGEGKMVPTDVYDHPEWYFYMGPQERETFDIVKGLRGADPETEVTVYRGAPVGELNTGDWIALTRSYAGDYAGDSTWSDNPNSKVYTYKVKAKHVVWQGDDIREFGYFGPNLRSK